MRLAVVSPFVDRRHGTERALAELLERLARVYGCEIHLYAQRVEDLLVDDRQSGRSAKPGVIIWHKVPSVPGPHVVQFLGWMFLNAFSRKWHKTFSGISYDLVLSPGINCFHPDVIIVHALFHRLKELSREESQDSHVRVGFFRRIHRRAYYGLLATLERGIYTDPRVRLAAVSKRTAGLMRKYFHREDVCVIPNGVDTRQFSKKARLARRAASRLRRGYRDEDFVLLLIGNDWRNKGLTTVLHAMAAISTLPLQLLVVGNDNLEPFRLLAAELGVEDRCRWEISNPDVVDFYASADVYVSPSREDSFGLPVAEAMACGLPAITSVFAGIADYIHDGIDGFVLREPDDEQTLSQLLARLCAEPDLGRALGEAASQKTIEWNWDRRAAATWEFLGSISAKTP